MSEMLSKIKSIMNQDPKNIICCILCIFISTELFYNLFVASKYSKEDRASNEDECKKKCIEDINCGFYNYNDGNCSIGRHPICRKVNILNIDNFTNFMKKMGVAIIFIFCNISILTKKRKKI